MYQELFFVFRKAGMKAQVMVRNNSIELAYMLKTIFTIDF